MAAAAAALRSGTLGAQLLFSRALQTSQQPFASARLLTTGLLAQQSTSSENRSSSPLLAGAAAFVGLVAGSAGLSPAASADAPAPIEVKSDPYQRPDEARPLPSRITLYQYEVCPYCCKVRAFLDFYKLPYTVIEVNPLTKGELRWSSSYKKVPVVKLDDEVVVDSSAIMSRLATDVAAARHATTAPSTPAPTAPAAAPAPTAPPAKKASWSFFGGSKSSEGGAAEVPAPAAAAAAVAVAVAKAGGMSAADLEHEARWRKWVDEKLVKVLTANIYRNWDEAKETFKYITDQTGWSWGTREAARWAGAVMMWQVGKRMPAKYGIEGDLRQALYDVVNDFVEHGLRGRRFAGGESPNLADLAAFGVVRAVRTTSAFRDMMEHSQLRPWFEAMEEAVGGSARVNPGPAQAA